MDATSLPVDLEFTLELLERDMERLMRAAEAFERNGNTSAAYEAITWKLALGRVYSEAYGLAESIREGRLLEASARACSLIDKLHTLMREAEGDRLVFVAAPSRRIIATLLTLASSYCARG